MKHNIKVTLIILGMFLITQFIGLFVVNHYFSDSLPFGLDTPDVQSAGEFSQLFVSIVFAFIIAISLILLLTKFNTEFVLKLWFFLVVAIALSITLNSFISFKYSLTFIFLLALGLAYFKIYDRSFLVHNITELFIYPGIAAIFVPILNVYTMSALLVLISAYDIWAVWHSGIMQKMAKYQIKKLNIFSGFFVPYVSKNVKLKLQKMKKSDLKKKKIRANVAVLGGGDVVFPIIAAGVMLKTLGILSAVFVIIGATVGLTYLMFFAEKKKFYPAMPYISTGIFAGMALGYLINVLG